MTRKQMTFLASLIGLWCVLPSANAQKPAYSTSLETALRTELFATNAYEVLQRPEQHNSITIGLTLLTINAMNIKDQSLSISGYLSVKWADSRLDWSNSARTSQDYTNVNFLFSTEEYVWRPALVIENSVKALKIISDKTVPLRIVSDGTVIWNPSGIYEVSCESDTTYYPLDNQECKIKVSSWAYTEAEVSLVFNIEPIDLSFYSENGEWNLISATGSTTDTKSRGGIAFSSLEFSIKLQRRPMFHVLNTLFPVALMAVLIAMVFKLSVDSGEKIGFSLTVLLAYAVYLTMISDNIPSTSVTVCYLSVYLAFILTLAAISVCLTIFVLSLHFKPENKAIPKWVRTVTNSCLVRIACMEKCRKCTKGSKVDEAHVFDNTTIEKLTLDKKGTSPVVEVQDENELTWQLLSVIMDKVFFNVYISLIGLATSMLLLVIFVHYYSS